MELPEVLEKIVGSYLFGSFYLDCKEEQLPSIGYLLWRIDRNELTVSDGKSKVMTFRLPETVNKNRVAKLIECQDGPERKRAELEKFRRGVTIPLNLDLPQNASDSPICLIVRETGVSLLRFNFCRNLVKVYDDVQEKDWSHKRDVIAATAFTPHKRLILLDQVGELWCSDEYGVLQPVAVPLLEGIECRHAEIFIEGSQEGSRLADHVVDFLISRSVKSCILIADEIAEFNLMAFDHLKPIKARERAEQLGNQFMTIFQNRLEKKSKLEQEKIKLLRWRDVFTAEKRKSACDCFIDAFQKDAVFAQRVNYIADRFVSHRGQNKISASYRKRMSLVTMYILSELPNLLCGLVNEGIHYRTLVYGGTKQHLAKFAHDPWSLHALVKDIEEEERFAPLRERVLYCLGIECTKLPGWIAIPFV